MVNVLGAIRGPIVADQSTKNLTNRLKPKHIAIINHTNLDEVGALSLIEKEPLAIINFSQTLTGDYPTNGATRILMASIPIFDVIGNQFDFFNALKDGMNVEINLHQNKFSIPELEFHVPIFPITLAYVDEKIERALISINNRFDSFAQNSLFYAQDEIKEFQKPFPALNLKTKLYKRPVVVVVRSASAFADFPTVIPFINQYNPVLIGVDGGAEIFLKYGFSPDVIVGDMDSVSDLALYKAKDRVVHAYSDGHAPGIDKMLRLSLSHHVLPYKGTSEDVTLLMAFELGAKPIIIIGSHTHMIDFLEKGREGMGSTLLTRMKIGHVLIDLKGIHYLFPTKKEIRFSYILLASFIPLIALLIASPSLRNLLYAFWVEIRFLFY